MVNNKLEKKNLVGNSSADMDLTSWMEKKKATIDNFAKENDKTLIINVLHGLYLTINM